jgi:hypothetical protein
MRHLLNKHGTSIQSKSDSSSYGDVVRVYVGFSSSGLSFWYSLLTCDQYGAGSMETQCFIYRDLQRRITWPVMYNKVRKL